MQDATIVLIKSCLFLALESMHQQVGKDVCYRRTAAFKAHMRHYINEGKIFNLSVWANTTKKTLLNFRKCKLLWLGLPLKQENLTTSPPH